MSWRNKSSESSENAFEKFFNKKNNKSKFSKKEEEVKTLTVKPISVQIEEIKETLGSGKYMSKTKRDNLEKQLKELEIKKENEFPDLVKPIVFNNTPQRSVESIWSNSLNKLKLNEGIDELNIKMKKIYAEEDEKKRIKLEEKRKKKYYEKHKNDDDSDYDKDDFY